MDKLPTPFPKPKSEPYDATEENTATRFADFYADFRWCQTWNTWLYWTGSVWQQDKTLSVFDKVRSFCGENSPFADNDPDIRNHGKASFIAAVEKLCRSDRRYAITPNRFDANDWYLNTPDGIVDLETGQILPHDSKHYCKKITAVAPGGDCPRWKKFLEQVTDNDDKLITYLQRLAGYCLTGLTVEHTLHFFYGTGANGKSVFLNTLTGILSDYAFVAPMETFTESYGERHATELAALDGARLVVSQETEHGKRWAQSRIKSLTAGDPQTARKMRQDFYTFVPKLKLVIAGNAKPRLMSVDEAMRRRFHIVPFTVCIPVADRDPDLTETLVKEWPGILAWAIEGCLEYERIRLHPPESVLAATKRYLESQDIFAEWLSMNCVNGADHWHAPMLMFKDWKAFAENAGERPGQLKDFGERMENAGYHEGKDNARGRYWGGIKLRPREYHQ